MKNSRTAQEQSKAVAVIVLLIIIAYVCNLVFKWTEGGLNSSPTPNAPNYGREVDVMDEWIELPEGVEFRSCPLVSCRVVATSKANQTGFITHFEAGEIVDGIELWAVVNIDGTNVYAPVFEVLPQDEMTETVGTN